MTLLCVRYRSFLYARKPAGGSLRSSEQATKSQFMLVIFKRCLLSSTVAHNLLNLLPGAVDYWESVCPVIKCPGRVCADEVFSLTATQERGLEFTGRSRIDHEPSKGARQDESVDRFALCARCKS